MKDLVLQHGKMYNISDGTARVSITTYADRAVRQLPLDRGTSLTALRNGLYSVGLTERQRRVESGLQLVKDTIVNKRDGVKDARSKVVVLMVGGRSDPSGLSSIKTEVDSLSRAGAKTVVVGIGSDLDEAALKSAASKPDNFIHVKSGESLLDSTPSISDAVEDAGKTSIAADIVFILGAGGRNAEKDFSLAKRSMTAMLDKLDISENKARVGLVLYGERASIILRLDSFKNKESPAKVVERLRAPREGSALGEAVTLARNFVFKRQYGGRENVPKTAVIFVNRDVDDASELAVDGLRKDGVKVVAVSLGDKDVKDSLRKITISEDDIYDIKKDEDIEKFAKKPSELLLPGLLLLSDSFKDMKFKITEVF